MKNVGAGRVLARNNNDTWTYEHSGRPQGYAPTRPK